MWARFRSLLRALLGRPSFEQDMQDEIRFHIEQFTDDLVRSGVHRDEALRRARIVFGPMNTTKEECRQSRGLMIFDETVRELRHAARVLLRAPGFTVAALLTLGVCLGANLSIFAAVDAILLRPLPFPDSSRLVSIYNRYPKAGVDRDGSSPTNYYERRGKIPALQSISIYRYAAALVGRPGQVERLEVAEVSPEFFATLGVERAKGRTFTEEETSFDANNVVILTDNYRRRHFGTDQSVLGQQIRVNNRPLTVVGVLPSDFRFLSSQSQIYLPLASSPNDRSALNRHSGGNVIQMIARLSPSATISQAQAQLDAQNAALEADDPQAKMIADAGFRSVVVSLHLDHVAAVQNVLVLLQAGVLLLLLIGTVNLANLLLVRAHARAREFAVRQAIGASRAQLARETVIETTLLTASGGALGLIVALGGIRLLAALGSTRLPLGSGIRFDTHLALLGLLASVILGVILAIPFARFAGRQIANQALKGEGRSSTTSHTAQKLRHVFTVAQIALSFILLVGAGLLGLALKNATAVSPGFRPDQVLTGQILLTADRYRSPESGLTFSERLVAHLEREPGVIAAGVVNNIPFSGHSGKSSAFIVGYTPRPGESSRGNYSYGVAGDYFRAMGFSLLAGRFLEGADSRRAQRVCVVDLDFARHYWPDDRAVGHRLFEGSSPRPEGDAFTVVGVVSAAKQAGLTEDTAQGSVYYPYVHRYDNHFFAVVRTSANPDSHGRTLQGAVRDIDPGLSVDDVQTMTTRISDSLLTRRSPALLAGLFSGIAVLLTAIGTCGVLSYSVVQRRREIGVRMALGATPESIGAHFLFLAVRLLSIGTVIGLAGALLTGHAMRSVLFHVPEFDPMMIVLATVTIFIISLSASLVPAVRACRISPREAVAE